MTKMLSEILEEPSVLERIEKTNKETLEKFALEFKKRNITHITFAARGTSDHAAIFGTYLYTVVGNAVAGLAMCSTITSYGASPSYDNDLVIGISQSGSAEDVSRVLESASKNGAMTLAITNYPGSRLAKTAEFHLFCDAGEEKSVAATKTFTSQLALMILSCAYAYGRNDLLDNFRSLSALLDKTLTEINSKIDSYAKKYINADNGFILSRGFTYPIALESALKLQETCYVKMRGVAVSDFWHGPLAQVSENTPVIIYCAKGNCLENDVEMAEKVKSIGANLLIVTDDEETAGKFENSFLLPYSGSELTSPVLFASFVQCFAQSLCTLKGMNPDSPRNLHKVTVTI